MTTARELVRAATAAGAKFAMRGDKLSVTALRPLAPELVEELRRAKAEILRLLAVESGVVTGFPPKLNGGVATSRSAPSTGRLAAVGHTWKLSGEPSTPPRAGV
jgi:hypothetical protein